MPLTHASRTISPYAIAFSIEELILVRSWAEQRGLHLTVATDQVLDGAEFEEMLIIAPPGRDRPTLTLWRTATNVFAQTPAGAPRMFDTLKDLLGALRPAPPAETGWRKLLRMASR